MTAIKDLISSFLLDQDISKSSRQTYRHGLTAFYSYLTTNDIDLKEFKKADVLAYKNSMVGKMSPFTINSYLSSLRGYLKWLKANGHIEQDMKYKNVEVDQYSNKKPLTDYQIRKLMKSIQLNTEADYRDYTMIRLIVATGLRVSEVVSIQVCDIIKNNNILYIQIKGKGKLMKTDRVRITPNILKDLKVYIDTMGLTRNDYLFCDTKAIGKQVTSTYVSLTIKKRLVLAGIKGHEYSAHSLRHTFAIRSLHNGMSIEQVSSALRHKSLGTTMIYLSKYRQNLINTKVVGNIIESNYFITKSVPFMKR